MAVGIFVIILGFSHLVKSDYFLPKKTRVSQARKSFNLIRKD